MPARLDEPIVGQVRPHPLGDVVLGLFADLVAHVETGEISHGQGAHRHAPFVHGRVNVLYFRSFFDEKRRLSHVRAEHPVADEAPAVADEYADFA